MPHDLLQPMILAFVIAIGVVAYELRAALEAPVCSQCVHCRLLAAERRQAEERPVQWPSGRAGSPVPDDSDPDDRAPRH